MSLWQEKSRRIDDKLRQATEALDGRNEQLLALRPGFCELEKDFWRVFARRLGCENPAETIDRERARLSSVVYLAVIISVATLSILLVVLCQWLGNTLAAVTVCLFGIVAVAAMIGTPLTRIARARKVVIPLALEQEPFWLTGGSPRHLLANGSKMVVGGEKYLCFCTSHRRAIQRRCSHL